MLVSDETFKTILALINDRLNAIIVKFGGESQLQPAELKTIANSMAINAESDSAMAADAYIMGLMGLKSKIPENFNAFKAVKNQFVKDLTPAQKYGLKLATQKFTNEIIKHRDVIKSVVADLVLAGNYDYKNVISDFKSEFEEEMAKSELVRKLVTKIRDKTGDLYRDWNRVIVTETTNNMNAGVVDQMLGDDKAASEIYVYKSITIDAALCDYCRKFYLESNGATPKVYPLSELIANGTNVGRKKSEWKPVVGATHPHCRGKLLRLNDGWGFTSAGSTLKYFGPKFLWYRDRMQVQ